LTPLLSSLFLPILLLPFICSVPPPLASFPFPKPSSPHQEGGARTVRSSKDKAQAEVIITGETPEDIDAVKVDLYSDEQMEGMSLVVTLATITDPTTEPPESSGRRLCPSNALFGLTTSVLAASQAASRPHVAALLASVGALSLFAPTAQGESVPSVSVDVVLHIPSSRRLNMLLLEAPGETKIDKEVIVENPGCRFSDLGEPSSNIPFPKFSPKCPRCCSGRGTCSEEGCVCEAGYDGAACQLTLPGYISNSTGLPSGGYKRVDYLVWEGNQFLVIEVEREKRIYTAPLGSDPVAWVRFSDAGLNQISVSEDESELFVSSKNRIYSVNATNLDLIRIDNLENGPREFRKVLLTPRYIVTQINTNEPVIHLYTVASGTWNDTRFPFSDLDGKPHVDLVVGDQDDIYYESNYSGVYRYVVGGTWEKMRNVIAPPCFRFAATNSRTRLAAVTRSQNPKEIPTDRWVPVTRGLPPVGEINSMTSLDGFLFASVKDSPQNGIYQFDGERWHYIAKPSSGYGSGALITVGSHIYSAGHQSSLLRLSLPSENEFGDGRAHWVRTGRFLDTSGGRYSIHPGKNAIYFHKDTESPKFYKLVIEEKDVNQGILEEMPFPYSGLDGKPHIQLVEDKDGNVWYVSNYSGVYKYIAAKQEWIKVHDRSGKLSMGKDGQIYLSYEVTPTTQISSFFLYREEDGGHHWDLIHTDRGYGIGCEALDEQGSLFCIGGRFSEFVIWGTKKWDMPSNSMGLPLPIHQSCRNPTALDGAIFCELSSTLNGNEFRTLIGLKPDLSGGYYDSNLDITTGTYLGGRAGTARAVKILSNGNIVAVFDSSETSFGGKTVELILGAGMSDTGRLLVLNPEGNQVLKAFSLGMSVLDVNTLPTDPSSVMVATAEGVSRVSLDDGSSSWTFAFQSSKKKVAASSGHVAAMLANNRIALFTLGGEQLWNITLSRSYTEDVALSTEDQLVIIAGFDNKRLPGGNPVQVAFLEARSFSDPSNVVWRRFSFNGADLSNNIADTRLYHCNVGADGKLYILGESAGSQTIFRYDGIRYSGKVLVTAIDFYNDLWNTKSPHISYQARVNLTTGQIEGSQLTMARLTDGGSNTFKTGDIAGDHKGNLYVVGKSAAFYANRAATSINGVPVGQYHGDPVLLWIRPDFRNRNAWNSFIRDKQGDSEDKLNYGGILKGVAVDHTKAVVIGEIKAGGEGAIEGNPLVSVNSLQVDEEDNPSAVYLAVIPIADRA